MHKKVHKVEPYELYRLYELKKGRLPLFLFYSSHVSD